MALPKVEATTKEEVMELLARAREVKTPEQIKKSDRIGCLMRIYQESFTEQPTQYELGFSKFMEGQEPPESYRDELKEKWQLLKLGRLSAIRYVVIENRAGWRPSVNPTPEEQKAIDGQIVIVEPNIMISAGRFSFFEPIDAKKIRIKAKKGIVPVKIYLFGK